ncbi:MAG: hypothetical protein IT375_14430 [Polyangiaceae bacterium]|nr:hypothetical protein [Polyangiaceae bacterium]
MIGAACQGGPAAGARTEADQLVNAVRALREADNADKPARLAALRGTLVSEPDLTELKAECVSAYELYTQGLDAVRAVKKSLASDGGDDDAKRAGELLAGAERDVAAGKQRATRCAEGEGRVVAKYKLK